MVITLQPLWTYVTKEIRVEISTNAWKITFLDAG